MQVFNRDHIQPLAGDDGAIVREQAAPANSGVTHRCTPVALAACGPAPLAG